MDNDINNLLKGASQKVQQFVGGAEQNISQGAQMVGQGLQQFGKNVLTGVNQNIVQPVEQLPGAIASDIQHPQQILPQVGNLIGGAIAGTAQGINQQLGSPNLVGLSQYADPNAQQRSLQYEFQNPVPTALNTLGLIGGPEASKVPGKISESLNNATLDEFGNKLQNISPSLQQNSFVKQIQSAMNVSKPEENALNYSIDSFNKGNIGDTTSNNVLQAKTSQYLPQFSNLPTTDQANIWENIFNLRDKVMPQQVHPTLSPLINAVRGDLMQTGKINFGATVGGNATVPFGEIQATPQVVSDFQKELPQIQANRAKYDQPGYISTIMQANKFNTWEDYLNDKSNVNLNNHAGGPDALKNARGTFGFIPVSKDVIPEDPPPGTVLDERVVKQYTENNGDMPPVIVKANGDGTFTQIDGHHRFPTSRAIGLDKIPAIVLDDKAPSLSQSWDQMRGVGKGEKAITMEDVANYKPDYTTAKGINKVQKVLDNAEQLKPEFDKDIQAIADDNGAEFQSRIKSMDSSIRKVVQQRIEGKTDYDEKGLNDAYGARIIIKDPKDEAAVKADIEQAAKDGDFEIRKSQSVDKETYHAYHYDIQKRLPDGRFVRGEIQIHTPQSLAEAVKNHPIRSVFGENPPQALDEVKKENAQEMQSLPNDQAMDVAKKLEDQHKQVGEVGAVQEDVQKAQQLSNEGVVNQGQIQPANVPTQTEIKNRAEINAGNPDLYTQRQAKLEAAGIPTPKEQEAIAEGDRLFGRQEAGLPESPLDTRNTMGVPVKPKGVEVPADERSVGEATFRGGGVDGKIASDVNKDFARWTNERGAKNIEGARVGNMFRDLDKEGIQNIFKFQEGERSGRLAEVQELFDKMYNEEKDAGIPVEYRNNYIYQLWKDPEEKVSQAFNKTLGLRPGFSLHNVVNSYEEGINKYGLTPRYTHLSDIIEARVEAHEKAMADARYFNSLAKQGLILPKSKAPVGWDSLDPEHFPTLSTRIDDKTYSGLYYAPSGLAKKINNYLGSKEWGLLKTASDVVSKMKRVVMSVGVPGTAINPHGANILTRAAMFDPIKGLTYTLPRIIVPKLAQNDFVKSINSGEATDWRRSGLMLSAEDAPENFMQKATGVFERPLFGSVIPATKIKFANSFRDAMIKRGVEPGEAMTEAANITNNAFGGNNWDALGMDKNLMHALQMTVFAPDWMRTNFAIPGNMVKSLFNPLDPKSQAYRNAIGGLVALYAGANAINYLTTGKYMFQNPSGHQWDIGIGFTKDGQFRYLRPFGTAADFARLPQDIATSAMHGDFSTLLTITRNRLAAPVGLAVGLISNTDTGGQPIYGHDAEGNPMTPLQSAGGIAGNVVSPIASGFAKGVLDLVTGNKGVEQSLSEGLGLPVRYTGGNTTKQVVLADQQQGKSYSQTSQDVNDIIRRAQNKSNAINSINMNDAKLTSAMRDAVQLYYDTQSNDTQTRLFKDQLLTSPTIFNLVKQVAVNNANGDMSKVDPLLAADTQSVKDYLTYEKLNNSAAGSTEEKQFLKNHQDVLTLMQQRNTYFAANPVPATQAKQSIFGTPSSLPQAPQVSSYVQQQLAAKNFNDPQVQQYLTQHLDYINQVRQSQGLDPIDQYGNIQGSKNYGSSSASGRNAARRMLMREGSYAASQGRSKVRSLMSKMSHTDIEGFKAPHISPPRLGSKTVAVNLKQKGPGSTKSVSSMLSMGKSKSSKHHKISLA